MEQSTYYSYYLPTKFFHATSRLAHIITSHACAAGRRAGYGRREKQLTKLMILWLGWSAGLREAIR